MSVSVRKLREGDSSVNLDRVVLQSGLTKKCPQCQAVVAPRKIKVKWKKTRNPIDVQYFPTDVMYCKNCYIGMMHSFFAQVTDSSGTSWSVETVTVRTQQNIKVAKQQNKKSSKKQNNKTIIRPIQTTKSPAIKHQKIDRKISSKKSSYVTIDVQTDDRITGSIPHKGSPRSKQDSTSYNSAGLFRHGKSNREWDDIWEKTRR